MSHVIAIVGPTAVGKSDLALHLAQACGGEIVSADSRQVYRYMDIGTAKPTPEAQAAIPHHLIDVVDPDDDFTLAIYQSMADAAIGGIHRRGRLAFLVGGSGLYVRAVTSGFRIPHVAPDAELRLKLQGKAAREGSEALYEELKLVDPAAAEKIDLRNVRRVIRALEVFLTTGVPFSQMQGNVPPFHTLVIGLTTSREDLYNRIDSRVDRMLEQGLVHEVKQLLERGYSLDLPSMSGIGYRHIGQYLQGGTGLEAAILQMKYDTHRFARHQYAWFRPSDKAIHWFDIREAVTHDICELVMSFISEKSTAGSPQQVTKAKQ